MGMLIGMAALCAVFSYVSIGSATSYRFLPRTTVNGTDVSGMTLEEAAAALDEADGGYELTVRFRKVKKRSRPKRSGSPMICPPGKASKCCGTYIPRSMIL